MQVFIHVGPSKTGSSAIQKWLNDNTGVLFSQGVFYPKHPVDQNGISSGNVLSVFKYDMNGVLTFCEEKASKLVKECLANKCDCLLLSSEAFAGRFEALLAFFSNCKVIFYLRNPLDCAESLYNQSVKRHFNTEKIRKPEIGYNRLLRLNKYIKQTTSARLDVRLFGKQFFKSGDIVSDFLDSIGVNLKSNAKSTSINLSYSFEALELKRALNYFPSITFHTELDQCLQSYSGGVKEFSILSPEQYGESVKEASICLHELSNDFGKSLEVFVNSIQAQKQKKYLKQVLTVELTLNILGYIKEVKPSLFLSIQYIIRQALLPLSLCKLFALALEQLSVTPIVERNKLGWLMNKPKELDRFSVESQANFSTLIGKLSSGSNDKMSANFRDIGLYLEAREDYLEAYRFMLQAKLKKPHGKLIDQKLKKYSEIIFESQRSERQ
ncbi:hypothetical protein [uncultured Paraglaciecola sp.]|uniref:hypothetical protein n=1 Tax=uncultured Paraglaciecola sp. TaxID=1765024 RepID=UPI0025997B31|nr:hypothetical protein [uncultured Paraglaciecola sp.]